MSSIEKVALFIALGSIVVSHTLSEINYEIDFMKGITSSKKNEIHKSYDISRNDNVRYSAMDKKYDTVTENGIKHYNISLSGDIYYAYPSYSKGSLKYIMVNHAKSIYQIKV